MKPLANKPPLVPDAWELLHALPQAIIVIDHTHIVQEMNDAAEQLLGVSRRNLRLQPMESVLASDSMLPEIVAMCFASGAMIRRENRTISRTSHGPLSVNAMACPVFDADYPLPLSVIMLLEPVVRTQNPQDQSASLMAAMLAHEVKNPLSGIRGAAQLIGKQLGPDDKPLAELICREVDRINALLQKIEFFSNEPASCDEAVNIHEVLEIVRDAALSGFGSQLRIETRYDPSLPCVCGDKTLLVQLFMNLVKNAAEALDGRTDGIIVIGTRYQLNHTLRDAQGGTRSLPINIVVEDNAAGIPELLQEHLFRPFVTTKVNGSGLGLAVVSKIVDNHGGQVHLEQRPEGGTRVTIRLMTHPQETLTSSVLK